MHNSQTVAKKLFASRDASRVRFRALLFNSPSKVGLLISDFSFYNFYLYKIILILFPILIQFLILHVIYSQMCLASVTRPIKRGKLFNNVKPRKPMLSRHYKYAQLSVNFHQFDVCYWMSFSRQHGAKFSANSFMLELKDELTLSPVEDGLIHRPTTNWSVIYLNSILTGTKIWLCSSQATHQDEVRLSFVSVFVCLLIFVH